MSLEVSNDYRNTCFCTPLNNIYDKKQELEDIILTSHPGVNDIYRYIKEKRGAYFKPFCEIYNRKCAYCGAHISLGDIRLFEIDHFICKSSLKNNSIEANKTRNLVFSCYACNRGKSKLVFDDEHKSLLNPDDNSIANVFYRDEEYYIKINERFTDDRLVQQFYNKLSFNDEFRRLDYFLLEINGLNETLNHDSKIYYILNDLKNKLMSKRNNYFLQKKEESQ
nr:MAG TPA: HNH endonuclease [Caudoviricetes sp.]